MAADVPKRFAAHDRPALAVLARLGFPQRRRQCLRAVVWPQNVGRNEGEECSAEACRRQLRGRSSRACQRGSVITSDRQHLHLGNRSPKGELGSRWGAFDYRRVPEQAAVGSAAVTGRRLPAQEDIVAAVRKSDAAKPEGFAASVAAGGAPGERGAAGGTRRRRAELRAGQDGPGISRGVGLLVDSFFLR